MRGAFKRRLAPVWRGVGLLSASLILSLTTLAPAAAAPAKKAKAAEARPAAKAKPAAPSKSTAAKPASKQVTAKATSGKAAKTAPQVAAKGKAAKADVQEAKASKRDRGGKSAKRAFAEERRGGKTNVARGSDRVQRTLSARGKANERAERMAARETRLAIRTVAHVPQEARPARLSFGQLAGLRGVEDPLELKSSVALVLDQDTHEVLLSKNDHAVLPIASLTKLMTGLIVSDARLPLDEMISITEYDIDYEKGSRSRLPVGTTLTRGELMHLALMSSENRAAHALGPVDARQLVLDTAALGHVAGQHLPRRAPAEVRVAHDDFHVQGGAVLACVAPQPWCGRGRPGCMGLAAQHVECAGGRVLVLRGPERAQLHAQQLLLRMAVVADHGVVHRQQTQAVAVADPHGLRMFGKERAVLLLGRTQLRVHAPQLQHGAQRLGQDAQVQQVLRP